MSEKAVTRRSGVTGEPKQATPCETGVEAAMLHERLSPEFLRHHAAMCDFGGPTTVFQILTPMPLETGCM